MWIGLIEMNIYIYIYICFAVGVREYLRIAFAFYLCDAMIQTSKKKTPVVNRGMFYLCCTKSIRARLARKFVDTFSFHRM